jgi:hypothetical protein
MRSPMVDVNTNAFRPSRSQSIRTDPHLPLHLRTKSRSLKASACFEADELAHTRPLDQFRCEIGGEGGGGVARRWGGGASASADLACRRWRSSCGSGSAVPLPLPRCSSPTTGAPLPFLRLLRLLFHKVGPGDHRQRPPSGQACGLLSAGALASFPAGARPPPSERAASSFSRAQPILSHPSPMQMPSRREEVQNCISSPLRRKNAS